MSSCLPTISPARSIKAVRMSNARLPSRAGLSPSSRSLCATKSRNGPKAITRPSMRLHIAFADFTQFYLTQGSARNAAARLSHRRTIAAVVIHGDRRAFAECCSLQVDRPAEPFESRSAPPSRRLSQISIDLCPLAKLNFYLILPDHTGGCSSGEQKEGNGAQGSRRMFNWVSRMQTGVRRQGLRLANSLNGPYLESGRQILWEDGERVLCREWRRSDDDSPRAVLTVLTSAYHPSR